MITFLNKWNLALQTEADRQQLGAVVVVDLDLFELPPAGAVVNNAKNIRQKRLYQAIFANGLMHLPWGYYDTFATILLRQS